MSQYKPAAPPDLVVRMMRDDDARAFLEIHHAAIRAFAVDDYPPEVIEDWAPLPIRDETVAAVIRNPSGETRLIAELNGKIVGLGALMTERSELVACYVAPGAERSGVGTAIVRKLEEIARSAGCSGLVLNASLTAEPFYAALGYRKRERSEHRLRSGAAMACVVMEKELD